MLLLRRDLVLLLLAGLGTLSACGRATSPATAAQAVAIQVNPTDIQVGPAGNVQFAATVTGTIDASVTWDVVEAAGGAVDASGAYTAPSTTGIFHVRATSRADGHRQATATVTVTPVAPPPSPTVAVTVAPTSGAADACKTLKLSASVTGAADGAVTWSVQEGAAGGAVATDGTYTAPAAAGTYHVVATSRADATRRAIATVVVTERVLSVAIDPASVDVPAGGTTRFAATVTTTCGAYTAMQTSAGAIAPN
jgi:hypothetical protein